MVFQETGDLKYYRAPKTLQLSFAESRSTPIRRICGSRNCAYAVEGRLIWNPLVGFLITTGNSAEDRPLMTVRYGIPALPKVQFDEEAFRSTVTRIFSGISESATDLLLDLVKEAEGESHGTMLLISTAAEEEAKRLAPQGTTITPRQLTPELLKHLTPIDGAILIDPDSTCHAIGTILDGKSTTAGDPARGARFNSAVRYVESSSDKVALPCGSRIGGRRRRFCSQSRSTHQAVRNRQDHRRA